MPEKPLLHLAQERLAQVVHQKKSRTSATTITKTTSAAAARAGLTEERTLPGKSMVLVILRAKGSASGRGIFYVITPSLYPMETFFTKVRMIGFHSEGSTVSRNSLSWVA